LAFGFSVLEIQFVCNGSFPAMLVYYEGLHRQWFIQSAEEISHAAVWLCSDGASMLNGIELVIDGGSFAH
jgi:hypothetical protein